MDALYKKIGELITEMKRNDLWKKQVPPWVHQFSPQHAANENDFAGWLQFVCLPNLLVQAAGRDPVLPKNYVTPQAMRFFDKDVQKGKLLQLLIEIDALL